MSYLPHFLIKQGILGKLQILHYIHNYSADEKKRSRRAKFSLWAVQFQPLQNMKMKYIFSYCFKNIFWLFLCSKSEKLWPTWRYKKFIFFSLFPFPMLKKLDLFMMQGHSGQQQWECRDQFHQIIGKKCKFVFKRSLAQSVSSTTLRPTLPVLSTRSYDKL